jgi:hypothetical protein
MAENERKRLDKGSAADLLSTWRAAERDHAAAIDSANTSALAAAAAERAAKAARETAEAARLSLEAAQRADNAARETAEAADVLSETAARDRAAADRSVDATAKAEAIAKDAFHTAQSEGFPKESD